MNQTWNHHSARVLAPVVSGAFLIGCVDLAPAPAPAPASTVSAAVLTPPAQCEEMPGCAFSPAPASAITMLPSSDRGLFDAMSCDPIYLYTSGATQGLIRGTGSFCVDSTANRQLLHGARKAGFLPRYCQSCVGVPAGKLFVFWDFESSEGPNCPSTCTSGPAAIFF